MSLTGDIVVCVERHNVNDDSVVILSLSFASGEAVCEGDVVLEIETSKTNLEVTSPASGTLLLHAGVGEEVDVGAPLFTILADSSSNAGISQPAPSARMTEVDDNDRPDSAPMTDVPLFSQPADRRRQELQVPIDRFTGKTWVTVEDVEAAAGLRPTPPNRSVAPSPPAQLQSPATTRTLAGDGPAYAVTRRTQRKRAESNNLTVYGNALPQSTIWIDIDLPGTRVAGVPYLFEDNIADLVVYEASRLLRRYPTLNAFHIDDREYGIYESINFGISFDSGENLKVLAINDSDLLSLPALQQRYEELLHLYESGDTLSADLLTSATVTLSDLSRSPSVSMLPLLNGRQSLIIGVSRPERSRYSVAASFDHRVSEGLTVATFLGQLSERIISHFRDDGLAAGLKCFACQRTMKEELALGARSMLQVKRPDGADALICRNCFEGW